MVTISWPLITSEDIKTLSELPTGEAGHKAEHDLYKQRLLRLVEHGLNHPQGPALLTLADLFDDWSLDTQSEPISQRTA